MECGEAMGTGAPLGQGPSAPAALTDNPQAQLTVAQILTFLVSVTQKQKAESGGTIYTYHQHGH